MLRVIVFLTVFCLTSPAFAQAKATEEQAWNDAISSGSIESYQQYLNDFPSGRYANLAFRCTVELALMEQGHQCSAINNVPGPIGPVRSKLGQFSVTLR